MYAHLTGTIKNVSPHGIKGATIVLDANGVGYQLITTPRTVASLSINTQATLYTHLVVQETVLELVGFQTIEERDLFNLLVQASGVGVRVALALMTDLSVSDIVQAIVSDQHKLLTVAKGVGPKLAQKLVLELQTKMKAYGEHTTLSTHEHAVDLPNTPAIDDARSVLLSLGYHLPEIHQALENSLTSDGNTPATEDLLQTSLRWLAVHG